MAQIGATVLLTLIWPAVQLAVFWLRFGRMPPGGPSESLVFVPMGLFTAIVAVGLWSRSETLRRRRFVAYGYAVACPFAFVGSLLGGLMLPGVWGPLVFGGCPLIAGCLIGFAIGGPPAERRSEKLTLRRTRTRGSRPEAHGARADHPHARGVGAPAHLTCVSNSARSRALR